MITLNESRSRFNKLRNCILAAPASWTVRVPYYGRILGESFEVIQRESRKTITQDRSRSFCMVLSLVLRTCKGKFVNELGPVVLGQYLDARPTSGFINRNLLGVDNHGVIRRTRLKSDRNANYDSQFAKFLWKKLLVFIWISADGLTGLSEFLLLFRAARSSVLDS